MLIWSIYKENPEASQADRAEYYSYQLLTVDGENGHHLKAEERHGWWSELEKRAILHSKTLSPEGGQTFVEAHQMLDAALQSRVRQGYKYLFGIDPMVPNRITFTLTESDTLDTIQNRVREMW